MAGQILAAAMTTASAAAIGAALVWSVWPSDADAASQGLTSLTGKSPVVSTDAVPVQASGGNTLQQATASDIRKYVLTSVDTYGADPTGSADSTTAWQNAINSGLPLTCQGTYKVSATLLVGSPANDGQVIRGGGSWGRPDAFNSTTPAGACVIKPTAAVAIAIKIDGTGFSGGGSGTSWVQGFSIENLSIDMTNMTDASTSVGINQVQAWDCYYKAVRVRNDGTAKRAWLFSTGAYVSTLMNTQGNILDFEGTNSSNGVTTITVLGHDGGQAILNYANSIRFIGGAFQGTGTTKFYIRNSADTHIETDAEGTGTYLNVDSSVNGIFSRSELQGFSGTYMTGTASPAQVLLDQQTNFNTYPFNLDFGHININNAGTASFSSFLSGAAGANYYLDVGRTGMDVLVGAAAASNDFVTGTVAGDAVVGSWGGSSTLWLAGAQVANAKVTSAGFYSFGTGTAKQGVLNLKPASDTDASTIQNAAGTYLYDFLTAATASSSAAEFVNGVQLIGYSGNFTGQTWKILTSTGVAQFQGVVAQPSADPATAFQVNNAAGTSVFAVTTNATAASSNATAAGTLTANKGVITPALTVATLPGSPTAGQHSFVTDATACTFNSAVTGGAAVKCPVVYNGTSWVAG